MNLKRNIINRKKEICGIAIRRLSHQFALELVIAAATQYLFIRKVFNNINANANTIRLQIICHHPKAKE